MKFYKIFTTYWLLLIFVFFTDTSLQGQSCDCTEYVYLNETSNNGAVHKFEVNETFNEITDAPSNLLNEIGSPWYSNAAAMEELTAPHGLGSDLNGFLYIGETNRGDIRRLTCDGEILPESDFVINDGGYNIASEGNTLYVNSRQGEATYGASATEKETASIENGVYAYDLCTGDPLGYYCFDNMTYRNDWGMFLADDGYLYVTSNNDRHTNDPTLENYIYRVDINSVPLSDINDTNPDCIAPLLTQNGNNEPQIGTAGLPVNRIYGITVDAAGNIYIVERIGTADETPVDDNGNPLTVLDAARILKYDSNGILQAITALDIDDGDGGWYNAIGIYYLESTDLLLVSTRSPFDDCVSLFDPNLNYLGAAIGPTGSESTAKGISILSECCPNPSTIVIDTLFCDLSYPMEIFLQDLIDCNGIICEGGWTPDAANTGIDFNACNNSIDINNNMACGTFELFSDGSNALAQCGQFSVTINIETAITPSITVSGSQNICVGDALSDLIVTSNSSSSTYQWQTSTVSCDGPWTDIAGATSDTYTPPADLSATTYYQVIVAEMGDCATGSCDVASDCITITVNEFPESKQLCQGKTLDLIAETGYTSYQWYKDEVAIPSGTTQTITVSEAGAYIYTTDGGTLNDGCTNQMCCPISVEVIDCCPSQICLPVSITKN